VPDPTLERPPQQLQRPPGAERRGCPRYACGRGWRVRYVVRPSFHSARGLIRDISASGVCLVVGRRLEPGTVLLLQLPSGPTRLARVVRVRDPRWWGWPTGWVVGCRFATPLGDLDLTLLRRQLAG